MASLHSKRRQGQLDANLKVMLAKLTSLQRVLASTIKDKVPTSGRHVYEATHDLDEELAAYEEQLLNRQDQLDPVVSHEIICWTQKRDPFFNTRDEGLSYLDKHFPEEASWKIVPWDPEPFEEVPRESIDGHKTQEAAESGKEKTDLPLSAAPGDQNNPTPDGNQGDESEHVEEGQFDRYTQHNSMQEIPLVLEEQERQPSQKSKASLEPTQESSSTSVFGEAISNSAADLAKNLLIIQAKMEKNREAMENKPTKSNIQKLLGVAEGGQVQYNKARDVIKGLTVGKKDYVDLMEASSDLEAELRLAEAALVPYVDANGKIEFPNRDPRQATEEWAARHAPVQEFSQRDLIAEAAKRPTTPYQAALLTKADEARLHAEERQNRRRLLAQKREEEQKQLEKNQPRHPGQQAPDLVLQDNLQRQYQLLQREKQILVQDARERLLQQQIHHQLQENKRIRERLQQPLSEAAQRLGGPPVTDLSDDRVLRMLDSVVANNRADKGLPVSNEEFLQQHVRTMNHDYWFIADSMLRSIPTFDGAMDEYPAWVPLAKQYAAFEQIPVAARLGDLKKKLKGKPAQLVRTISSLDHNALKNFFKVLKDEYGNIQAVILAQRQRLMDLPRLNYKYEETRDFCMVVREALECLESLKAEPVYPDPLFDAVVDKIPSSWKQSFFEKFDQCAVSDEEDILCENGVLTLKDLIKFLEKKARAMRRTEMAHQTVSSNRKRGPDDDKGAKEGDKKPGRNSRAFTNLPAEQQLDGS